MTATGALALLVFLALAAPDLGVSLPAGDPFSSRDPLATQIVGPGLGAPGGAGWLGSTLFSQLALLVPIGAPAARLGGLAILAGLLAVVLTFGLYRKLALSVPSALIGATVAAAGGTSLSLVSTGSPDAVLAPLVPGLLLCGLWWADTRRPAALAVLAGVTVLGVGSYPVLLVVVCGVVAAAAGSPAAARLRPLAVTLGAVLVGLLHRGVATLLAARAASDALRLSLGTEPVAGWSAVVIGGPRVDAIEDRLSSVGSVLIGELGLPGVLLSLVGLATFTGRARGRGLAWSWVAALCWLVVWLPATPEGGHRVAAMLSWRGRHRLALAVGDHPWHTGGRPRGRGLCGGRRSGGSSGRHAVEPRVGWRHLRAAVAGDAAGRHVARGGATGAGPGPQRGSRGRWPRVRASSAAADCDQARARGGSAGRRVRRCAGPARAARAAVRGGAGARRADFGDAVAACAAAGFDRCRRRGTGAEPRGDTGHPSAVQRRRRRDRAFRGWRSVLRRHRGDSTSGLGARTTVGGRGAARGGHRRLGGQLSGSCHVGASRHQRPGWRARRARRSHRGTRADRRVRQT